MKIPILFDFQLKVNYICTITWEEFTSVVMNRCVIWNRNVTNCCRWSATPKLLQLIQSHICISVLVFCELPYFFGDLVITRMSYYFLSRTRNTVEGLFKSSSLYIRISFSDKLDLKFTVSQQFTSNFFRLQVLHYIFNMNLRYYLRAFQWLVLEGWHRPLILTPSILSLSSRFSLPSRCAIHSDHWRRVVGP